MIYINLVPRTSDPFSSIPSGTRCQAKAWDPRAGWSAHGLRPRWPLPRQFPRPAGGEGRAEETAVGARVLMAEDRRARGTGKYTEPLRPPLCPTAVSPGLLQEPPSLPVSTPVLSPPAFLHTAKVCSRDVVLIHVTLLIEAAGVCHLSSPSQGPASRRPPRPTIWVPVPSEPCLLLLFPTRVPSHPGFLLVPELFQQSLSSGASTGSPSAWDTPSPTAMAPAPSFRCLLTDRPARPAMHGLPCPLCTRRISPHAASRAARWLLPRRLSPSAAEARGVAAFAASSPPVSGRCSENTCGMRDCHQQRFYVYS